MSDITKSELNWEEILIELDNISKKTVGYNNPDVLRFIEEARKRRIPYFEITKQLKKYFNLKCSESGLRYACDIRNIKKGE